MNNAARLRIEGLLKGHGATSFRYHEAPATETIECELRERRLRFTLPTPDPDEARFTQSSKGPRPPKAARVLYGQACRERWYVLEALIRARLEAIRAGVLTTEQAFLGEIVLEGGATVYETYAPQSEGESQ